MSFRSFSFPAFFFSSLAVGSYWLRWLDPGQRRSPAHWEFFFFPPGLKHAAFKYRYPAAFLFKIQEEKKKTVGFAYMCLLEKKATFLLSNKSALKSACLYLSGLEFQICIHVPETAETVFTQHAAFTHITIKSAVQAAGNGINPPLLAASVSRTSRCFMLVSWRSGGVMFCFQLPFLRACLQSDA